MTDPHIAAEERSPVAAGVPGRDGDTPPGSPTAAMWAAVLGFFVITLDTLVVNVALPSIRAELGGGITGLQWVIDGYTLMFAALLLPAGALSDRVGARRTFAVGTVVFVVSSVGCGLAPAMGALVAARVLQGTGAALMTPSSLALLREAFPDPVERGRAITLWTISGSVAAATGPLVGGSLNLISWRAIFFINLPVGAVALLLLSRAARSPRRAAPTDVVGQVAAVVATGTLMYGVIEAGARGFGTTSVVLALLTAAAALAILIASQARGQHPMVPRDVYRSRAVALASGTGFAFIAAWYGVVFLFSLYLQQDRGLSSFTAGLVFVPTTVLSGFVSLLTAWLIRRFGPRVPIVGGMSLMGAGLVVLATLPAAAPAWLIAVLIIPIGICGPLAMQPTTGVLLQSVPAHRAGVAGGVFNTSRQLGGALAVAVFGALVANTAQVLNGLRESLVIAAAVAVAAAVANLLAKPNHNTAAPTGSSRPA